MIEHALPEPLVPAEVDLRDFAFMPLDVARLRDSALIAEREPEEIVAAILLWSASWHQEPAASLPDNDKQLAKLAGYGRGIRDFLKVKEGALHGFVMCSDGRWYHRVVAEKAAEGWNGKLKEQHKRACDRARKSNKERASRGEPEQLMPPTPVLLSKRVVDGIDLWRFWNSDGRRDDSMGIPDDSLRKSRLKREGEGQCKGEGEVHLNPELHPPLSGSPPDPSPATPRKINGSAYYADAEDVLSYLNKSAGKGYDFRNRNGDLTASAEMIVQRLKQGYTREELREVVHSKCEQWQFDDKMAEYLRPATLFAKKNFEQYLGELKGGTDG